MTRLPVSSLIALLALSGLGLGTAGASASAESPATSQVEWGPTVNGLHCSITLSQRDLRVGDPLVVGVKIQNVSDQPITIHYAPAYYEGERLAVETAQGEAISSFKSGITEGLFSKPAFERIAPGATFTTSINGRAMLEWANRSYLAPSNPDRPVILNFRDVSFRLGAPGTFRMSLRLSSDDDTAALGKRYDTLLWTGAVESNAVPFSVRLRTREELDRTIEELRSGATDEKAQAVQVIIANADREAMPALVEAMAAGVAGASEAVGALGDSSLVPRLMQMYRETQSDAQKEAVLDALQMASRDVFDFFAEVLGSEPSDMTRRTAAVRMADMAWMRKVSAVHALLAVLKTPDSPPKWGAIDGLAKLEDYCLLRPMVVSGLVTAMKSDPDRTVRQRAAGALSSIGDASVVPALIEALRDPSPWVGADAAHSLGRLAGPEAIEPLREYQKVAQTKSQTEAAAGAITAIQQRAQRLGAR